MDPVEHAAHAHPHPPEDGAPERGSREEFAIHLRMSFLQHMALISVTAFGGMLALSSFALKSIPKPEYLLGALMLFAFAIVSSISGQQTLLVSVEKTKNRRRLIEAWSSATVLFFCVGIGAVFSLTAPYLGSVPPH